MKKTIIGAWKLVTFEFRKDDGNAIYPFGKKAQGTIIYTESGRYSAQLMSRDRLRPTISDQMKATAEESESNFKGVISYFGSYKIEDGFIIHYVEGSLFPNMEGTEQKRAFEITDNRMQLTTPPTKLGGEKAVGVLIWERVD